MATRKKPAKKSPKAGTSTAKAVENLIKKTRKKK